MTVIALPPGKWPVTLGLGAYLKATATLIIDGEAHISEDCGTLENPQNILALERTARAFVVRAGGRLRFIAHDLHPDFPSTHLARRLAEETGAALAPVQHHHAHAAAIALEHGLTGPVLGLALDGFGLGPGGELWGGELLLCEGRSYRRLGHLAPLPQPGGDIAAREPWRMAAAALQTLGRGGDIAARFAAQPQAALLAAVLGKGLAPLTTSCGRLFDAACGLLGVLPVARFEGEAPMALERMAQPPVELTGGYRLGDTGVLNFAPLLAALADEPDAAAGARLFHGTLAAGLAAQVAQAAAQTGVDRVALGGGCFFNAVLKADLSARLAGLGLTALHPLALSPGDPGLSAGQAFVSASAP